MSTEKVYRATEDEVGFRHIAAILNITFYTQEEQLPPSLQGVVNLGRTEEDGPDNQVERLLCVGFNPEIMPRGPLSDAANTYPNVKVGLWVATGEVDTVEHRAHLRALQNSIANDPLRAMLRRLASDLFGVFPGLQETLEQLGLAIEPAGLNGLLLQSELTGERLLTSIHDATYVVQLVDRQDQTNMYLTLQLDTPVISEFIQGRRSNGDLAHRTWLHTASYTWEAAEGEAVWLVPRPNEEPQPE